jgi:hypothetical protein
MKKITLALSTLALVGTGSANAATLDLNTCGTTFVGQPQIISQPAVIQGANMIAAPATTLAAPTVLSYPPCYDGRLAGAGRGWFGGGLFGGWGHKNNDFLPYGTGLGYGGLGYGGLAYGNALGYGAVNGCNTMTFSSVIPATPGALVGAERLRNHFFDLSVLWLGFGFGHVNPRYDMRPIGE